MWSYMDRTDREILFFRWLGTVSCFLPIIIATFGLLGVLTGRYMWGSLSPEYIPMAPSTAFGFIFLSIIGIIYTYRPLSGVVRFGSVLMAGSISIFGFLKYAEYFTGRKVSFEQAIVPIRDKLGDIPIGIMSPATGAGFFLAGICVILYVYKKTIKKERKSIGPSLGIQGFLLTIYSVIMILGYGYQVPFLYESGFVVPMALTTAISFLLLGLGMLLLNGPKQLPLRVFMGQRTSAMLSRLFIPLVLCISVVQELIHHNTHEKAHSVISLGMEMVSYLGVTGVIIYIFVRVAGKRIDKEQQELRFQDEILKNVRGGIHLIGLDDGIIKYANPGCEQMFGYGPGEMIGKDAAEINSSNEFSSQETKDKIIEILVKKGKWQGEIENVKKDGTSFWCYASSSVFKHPTFGMVIVSVHTDITERKNIEKKVKGSEDKYRGIFNQAAVGVARVGVDGAWLEVNNKLCDIVGYDQEELLIKTFQDITHPDDLETDLEYLGQLLRGEINTYSMEKRYFKKNGDIVWVNLTASLIRNNKNEPEYFIAIVDDITEKKKTRESLKENESRYQRGQAVGHVGNWEYDPGTKLLWASDEAKRIYGFNVEEDYFATEEVEKCIPEKERTHQALVALIEHNVKYDLEFDLISRDKGIRKTINSIAEVERDAHGNPIKIIGVINDITKRKKSEEALIESEQKYSTLINELGVGVVLHAPDTSILLSNPKANEILGLSDEQMKGKKAIDPCWAFVRKDETVMPVEEYPVNKVFKLKKDYADYYLGIKRPDRKDITWITVNASIVFDENKKIKYATISFSDTTKQQKAEEESEKAKAYLDTIIDMSPFPLWVANREGTMVRANRSLRDAVNVTDEQLVGKYNVFNDENIINQGWMTQVKDVFYKQKPTNFKLQWKASQVRNVDFEEAHDVDVDVSMFPLVDKRGEVINVICQWVDITKDKEAQAIIKNLAKFSSENPNPVLRIAKDWKVLYANVAAGKVLKAWKTSLNKNVPERWQRIIEETLKTGKNRMEEERFDQGILSFMVAPVKDLGYVNLYARDITELRKIKKEIEDLAKFPSENPNPVVRVMMDGQVLYANEAARFMLSRKEHFAESEKILELLQENIEKAFAAGKENIFEETLNGRTYSFSVVPILKGNYANLYGKDITEIKVATKKLEKYKIHLEGLVEKRTQELVRTNEELEAFSYSVSHDLRAPLRSMSGFSHLLIKKEKEDMDPKTKDYLGRIIRATGLMGVLIDSLLMLSRVSRKGLIKEKVNMSEMATEIFSDLLRVEPKQKVEITIQSKVFSSGDKELLKILLQNLLANALKFSGKNPDAKIKFGVKHCKDEIQYFVQDNGAGFDEKYKDKLFGAFQRLHSESEFPGTGIGLTTVQRIINKHGGRVWAEGHPGKGATFHFTLPE